MNTNPRYRYRYCIVPRCTNTTVKTPNKIFFDVPRDAGTRLKWCIAMRRDLKLNPVLSTKSARHVCEDHFDLEKDTRNHFRWKRMGESLRLEKNVVPHIFKCQNPDANKERRRKTLKNRGRKQLIGNQVESRPSPSLQIDPSANQWISQPSTSYASGKLPEPALEFVDFEDAVDDNSRDNDSSSTLSSHEASILPDLTSAPILISVQNIKQEPIEEDDQPELLNPAQEKPSTATKRKQPIDVQQDTTEEDDQASTSSQTDDEDECDLYGKLVAKKLRKLPVSQREKLMYEIQGLFVEYSRRGSKP